VGAKVEVDVGPKDGVKVKRLVAGDVFVCEVNKFPGIDVVAFVNDALESVVEPGV
jgi:hypothetical protein